MATLTPRVAQVIRGFGVLKKCAAQYNMKAGKLDPRLAEAMMAEAYRLQTQVDAAEASKALENSGLRVTRAKERLEEARLFAAQQEAEASGQAQRAQQAFQAVRTPLTPTLTLLP